MRNTYRDYLGDTLDVHSHDKAEFVTFEQGGRLGRVMVDLNREQVDTLIHQLTEWKRMQPINPVRSPKS